MFPASENCSLAELRLLIVIRKVKFTDFVKRAMSLKPGFHMIVWIILNVRTIETIAGFHMIVSIASKTEVARSSVCTPSLSMRLSMFVTVYDRWLMWFANQSKLLNSHRTDSCDGSSLSPAPVFRAVLSLSWS